MRRRGIVLLGTSIAAAGALLFMDACTIINGLTVPNDAAVIDNAAPDGGDAALEDTGCHFVPPGKPNAGDTDDNKIVIAVVQSFGLSNPEGGLPAGFDLDDTCSGPETCVGPMAHPDPPGGIDNIGSDLFSLVNDRTDLEPRVNKGIGEGSQSILFRVANYNGKPDDPTVTVSIYASPGLFDPPDGSVNKKPQFLPTEEWALDEAQFSLLAPDLPVTTAQGWVRGGTVVAYLSAATTITVSSNFRVTLQGAIITAKLDLSGPQPVIKEGVIAGRWPAADILRVVALQRTADGGQALCDDTKTFGFVKGYICSALDIRSDRTSDGKGSPCDALSAAIRFVAAPAALGPHRTVLPDEDCPPEYEAGSCQ